MVVDEGTAIAAAFRLAHRSTPVPLSQDLSNRLLSQLGGEVTEVWLDGLRETETKARVLIRQGQRHLSVAAMPGDAVVLALTRKARIFTSEKVVTDSGIRRKDLDLMKDPHHGFDFDEGPGAPDPSRERPSRRAPPAIGRTSRSESFLL